jgi:hypothetical protein
VSLLGGEVTQSVVVSTQRAAGGQEALAAVPGRDVVVMHIALDGVSSECNK